MIIHGLNKLTLLDYPGLTACTLFTGGCNFRCPFCHNASLVENPMGQPVIPEDEIFAYLKKRQGILEGVFFHFSGVPIPQGGHHGNQIIGNDIRPGYRFYCKGNGIVIYHQKREISEGAD